MKVLFSEYSKCVLVFLIIMLIMPMILGKHSIIEQLKSSNTAVTEDETTTLVNVDHIKPTVNPDDFIVTTSMVKFGEEFTFEGKYEALATFTQKNGSVKKRDITSHVTIYSCGNEQSGIGACKTQIQPTDKIDTNFTGKARYRFILNFNGVRLVKDIDIYVIYDLDDMKSENYIYGTLKNVRYDADTAFKEIKYLYLEDQDTKVKYYANANTLNDNSFYFSGVPTNKHYKLYITTRSNSYELSDLGNYTGGVLNVGTFEI